MSRTFKDNKIKKELNKTLTEKKSGPHKEKKWIVCRACRGNNPECPLCKGDGIVWE